MLKKICIFFLLGVLSFVIFEGLSSTLLFVVKVAQRSRSSRAFVYHTRYDRDLGWENIPNYYEKDFYDPGVYVKTNAAGLRSGKEFGAEVPADKLRIVCSGDSFTFGVGVDNDHTWCQQLAAADNRLETVNMGEAGYGLDQMYLWYQRGGMRLSHDVQIFAVVNDDFRRLQLTNINGYGKPVLKIQNGELVPGNVPVPRYPGLVRWMLANPDLIFQLRSLQLLQSGVETVLPSSSNKITEMQREVVAKIVEKLQAVNQQKNSKLIFVYLPVQKEYSARDSTLVWRNMLRDESARLGVTFIDLLDDLHKFPKSQMETFFIPAGSQFYTSAAGHYSDYGNEFVARELYGRLATMPEVSRKLASLPAADAPHLDGQTVSGQLARRTK